MTITNKNNNKMELFLLIDEICYRTYVCWRNSDTVIHDEKVDRFEVFESGQIAYLQYDEKNGVLDILHTIVPPQLEGQGIAQALTEAAVRYASVVGLKIRPTCSFAKMFFTRHTQYKDMLVEWEIKSDTDCIKCRVWFVFNSLIFIYI